MERLEHIRKIFDALHMSDRIYNEETKEYDNIPIIKGEKREQLSAKLADLLTQTEEE